MNRVVRVFRNTSALIVARVFRPFVSIFLILMIARILGKSGLGEYNTIFSLITIFQVFASFGLKTFLTREVAKDKSNVNKYISNSYVIAIFLTFVSIALMCLTFYFLNYQKNVAEAGYILSISLFASIFIDCLEGIFTGYEEAQYIAYNWIIENVVRVLVSIWCLLQGYGLLALVVIYILTRFLNLILCLWFAYNYIIKILISLL